MKLVFKLQLLSLFLSTPVFASVVKEVSIDGQQYSCRPSNIEPECSLRTDLGFVISISADSADSALCLNDRNGENVKDCFIQRRLMKYANELDIQIASKSCKQQLVAKCSEVSKCSIDGKSVKCGYLGTFLRTLEEIGLDRYFSEPLGISMCQALIN